ncbi:hypothetical protein K488DRAFT_54271 [Vararia minispora EC-137]|uniref:Uncharacterized protein n=1 Tax=Vararia minispora EC-137 TaxID=1314806 RepID=A0ACB8QF10_9AGAM|nr:hypothetical protein K488DRAFT_54271 [Vararia minispora EC-137]
MSFRGAFDDGDAWAAPSVPIESGDIVADAMHKEKLIKEIAAAQEDLRNMLERVKIAEKDIDKLMSGNATLQMYIDNLTKQMAKQR